MITRELIIRQAKSWLGTSFRYQGRVKKNQFNNGGVDCLGLIFGVCDEINYRYNNKLLSYYDDVIYSKNPDYKILKKRFSMFFNVKDIEKIGVGDIILKKVSKQNYHLMFYNKNTFIHSSAIARKVVENKIDDLNEVIIYSLFE